MRMIDRVIRSMQDTGLIEGMSLEDADTMATAALEAMRIASDPMMVDGGLKLEAMMFESDPEYTGVIFKDCGVVYRTMIDAALNE